MKTTNLLGARLLSAIPYLTRMGRVIDVGTDHAYLPIHLIQNGISSRALACDINEGPIRMAQENIRACGMTEKIDTLLTDGLHGTEQFSPDDILIFGMGGELIARILDEAPWVKNTEIGLVLQPMSRASVLRKYLAEHGFSIVEECLTFEDRYYQTIFARWSGDPDTLTELEAWLGPRNLATRGVLFEGFVRHEIGVFRSIAEGKSRANTPNVAFELDMIHKMEELL